ncbi:MAG: bis(5'-nucleosyl)-tetraphosphatase (symmetrical) YqeK [Chloroflexi bacterium]|nr:bis(5'-nucleosyl)-tetraphosphatase (symmetrical) YqeK [Chloroflexota bacterium]
MESSLHRLREVIRALPQGLQDHLERVRESALALATIHSVPLEAVELAALGHDLARTYSAEALLARAQEWRLDVHPVEEQVPILLHGPVAAEMLRRQCGVEDARVLEAVRWHSTAAPGMGPVGLVVFLADKLEPHKLRRSPKLTGIAEVAKVSLERAVADYLALEMTVLLKEGRLVHPTSVEARNHLLNALAEVPDA